MTLFHGGERRFAELVAELVYCNPFTRRRIDLERAVLGKRFVAQPPVWSYAAHRQQQPNVEAIGGRVEVLVDVLHARLVTGGDFAPGDLGLYEDLALYRLYERHRDALSESIDAQASGRPGPPPDRSWRAFEAQFNRDLDPGGRDLPSGHRAAEVFACFFQIRRAFSHIFRNIVGGSAPAAALRAAVWQSIFTHDLRRYYRCLLDRMADFTTLIVGESGTGKELVAQAVGRARYIPFDAEAGRFTQDAAGSFVAVNLAALSPTLIESELFGHARGAFTGAVAERVGYLESCPPQGCVFLDEVGELDGAIQVKLLRVLQDRWFQRLGETRPRRFAGKIIAATNRDLNAELHAGRFRRDLYYRLCSDQVRTPALREQLADRPEDLHEMVAFIVRRLVTRDADAVVREVIGWIDGHLGPRYAWPGNFRELEQCVRSVIVRGGYDPVSVTRPAEDADAAALQHQVAALSLTAQQVVDRYAWLAYQRDGTYESVARTLDVDRRTAKACVLRARGALS